MLSGLSFVSLLMHKSELYEKPPECHYMCSEEQMDERNPEKKWQYVSWVLFLAARSYSFRANTVQHENIIRVGMKIVQGWE